MTEATQDARPAAAAPAVAESAGSDEAAASPGRRSERDRRLALAALAVIALLAAWTRFPGLDYSLWWDEVTTAHRFVRLGPERIFDPEVYIPNNHVLFSLVAWATSTFADTTERMLRLWSLVPALVGAAVLTAWAWRRLKPWLAVGIAYLIAVSPLHMELTPQARGYGLAFLSAAMMLTAAVRASEDPEVRWVGWWAVGGLLGILTLPTMALPFVLHGLVILARPDRRLRVAVTVGAGAVGLASLLFYRSLLGEILERSTGVGASRGDPPGLTDSVTYPLRLLLAPSVEQGLPLVGGTLALLVASGLAAAGVVALARRRANRPLLLHLVVPVVGTLLGMGAVGMHVRERYISFLLLHLLVLVVVGVAWLTSSAIRVEPARWPVVGLLAALAVYGTTTGLANGRELTTLPREDFKGVAAVLAEDRPSRVITNREHAVGFQYYLGMRRSDLEIIDPEAAPQHVCDAEPPFVFLDYPVAYEPIGDFSCLDERGAALISLPQRHGLDRIHIWILKAGG